MKRDTRSNDNGYGQVRHVESVNSYTVKNVKLSLKLHVSEIFHVMFKMTKIS